MPSLTRLFAVVSRRGLPTAVIVAVAALLVAASQLNGLAPAVAQDTKLAAATSFSPKQKTDIEAIVREYLLKNPEILLEMQQAFEAKMAKSRAETMRKSLKANASMLFGGGGQPVIGNPKGDVTVVEFFDYNCGFCRRAIPHLARLIESDKNVKVVFQELPIFGKDSEDASRVALAAAKQGKYWDVHKALLETPGKANAAKALKIAKKLGLDMDKIKADMKSDEVTNAIRQVQALARKMGINGTPHFFIGDQLIPGAPEDLYDQLLTRVKAVRKNGCSTIKC